MANATVEVNSSIILNNHWNSLKSEKNISYYETKLDDNIKRISLNGIQEEFKYFPKKVYGSPDIAEAIIIARSSVSQLERGDYRPINNINIVYNDWNNKTKTSNCRVLFVYVRGPWLELTYSTKLVEYLGNGNYVDKEDQTLSPEDSGTMKVQFKLTNIGNGHTYNTKYEILLEPNLEFLDYNTGTNKINVKKNKNGQTVLSFDYGSPILSKELKGGIIYLKYSKICDSYDILTPEEKEKIPKQLLITRESTVYMDLTNITGENTAVEHLRKPLYYSYAIKKKSEAYIELVVSGRRKNPTVAIKPKIKYFGEDKKDNIQIEVGKVDLTKYKKDQRNLEEVDGVELNEIILYEKNKFKKEIKDKPTKRETENKNHVVWYIVKVYGKNGAIAYSQKIKYEQKKIRLSTSEVVLIILSIIFYAASAFFIWRVILNYKRKDNIEGKVLEMDTNLMDNLN